MEWERLWGIIPNDDDIGFIQALQWLLGFCCSEFPGAQNKSSPSSCAISTDHDFAKKVPVEMHCPQSTIPTSLLGFGVINLMEGCTLRFANLDGNTTDD